MSAPPADIRWRGGEGQLWVAPCPWHPGFPPSAIRSQSGSSTTFARFGARRPERADSRHSPRDVETAQFTRTRRRCSFIRPFQQDESPRRTVQYPPFDGSSSYFGSLTASGSDPIGTSDREFAAPRPCCRREHGQRLQLASLGGNSTGALVPSSPSLRLPRTCPGIGARTLR